jgi:WS/DGAT/MGAT family acyltransferase
VEDLKAIKRAAGATVNDVVMALCAGALRQYLADRGALPDRPLVALIPVSLRTGTEKDPWTNRVSSVFATLPTTSSSPLDRLRQVHEAMAEAKARFAPGAAQLAIDAAGFVPPVLFLGAVRLATQWRLADRLDPLFNLIVSDIPGPRRTLWLEDAELMHYYPISAIGDSQALNITVQSYRDSMDFGLIACRDTVPDLQHLGDLLVKEAAELGAATGARPAMVAAPSPEPYHGRSESDPEKRVPPRKTSPATT